MGARIMISAGESSGEMHGAALAEAVARRGLDLEFFGLGGDRMAAAGVRLLAHVRDTAVMGGTEVLGALGRILAIERRLKAAMGALKPDALVLIDFPDFNFRLAREAKALGIPVIYYICPQVWAWRPGRLKFMAEYTSRRAVLFPFEKVFYEQRGLSADWVGHPVMDDPIFQKPIDRRALKTELGLDPEQKLLALLPGSRRAVAGRLAPVILGAAEKFLMEDYGLAAMLPKADSLPDEFIDKLTAAAGPETRARLQSRRGDSRRVLAAADLALLASGTSSVEAAFLGTPMAVVYKLSALSWFIAEKLVKVPHVSIANLVAGREIAPELLQDRATPENLFQAARPLLADGPARDGVLAELAEVRSKLGGPGASDRVADIIWEEINRRQPDSGKK